MFAKPQAGHEWLNQLVGEWEFRHECVIPDGEPSETTGTASCRSLGGMWLVIESTGESPEGSWTSIMMLGFAPEKGVYVGTFVGSNMSNLWLYEGTLEENRLTLNTQGPSFDGTGTSDYRDVIEVFDENTWWLRSSMPNDHGTWMPFMNGKHTRR
ncbi:MAG: DUF1579 domain-containing protein [Planctomycetaceae bacterium]